MRRLKPEVLAPAGSREALDAAIGAGADAVYFGLTDFNARIRARNFHLGDLPDVLLDLRRWGVRGYLVFNTLVFAEEAEAAREALEAIARAGPDGVIVQDVGVLRWLRRVAPELPVHASTQMTVASADGVRMAAALGASRVILARELTLAEIARIRAEVETELEVFVHGALCVSYSGQCLSSEAWGGRSANRGQCAQACRLPYDLIVDGKRRDLGDRSYLLSPRDLEGYRRVPELTALGISAFKIEGRMKSPEYVAASTALYRAAVDRAWAARGSSPGTQAELDRLAAEARQIFSRGPSEGFLGGVDHQRLVGGRTRAHRGLPAGTVVRVEADRGGRGEALILEAATPADGQPPVRLKAGDGILLAISPREEDEAGGRVLSVEPMAGTAHVRVRFLREAAPSLARVKPGTPVFRTSDPALIAKLRREAGRASGARRVELRARLEGAPGLPLRLTLTDPEGRSAAAESSIPCAAARRRSLDAAAAREALDRLGGTRYRLGEVTVVGKLGVFLPVSEIHRVRREAVARIEALRGGQARRADASGEPEPAAAAGKAGGAPSSGTLGPRTSPAARATRGSGAEVSPVVWAVERAAPREGEATPLRGSTPPFEAPGSSGSVAAPSPAGHFEEACVVLCRDAEQVRGAIEAGVRRVALDFLDLVGLREAAAELRRIGVRRTLALPRVQKAGEERIEAFFLGLEPEEILVRSLGGLGRLASLRRRRGGAPPGAGGANGAESAQRGEPAFPDLVGDVSLNAVNPDSIEVLLGLGLARIAPGLDLNGEQLESLAGRVDAARLEIPIYHHLPVFHTEHCVFAAFLSQGADFRSCGRPCDRHRIALRDRTGQSHPVVADVGCRNTVFGARAQSALMHLAALRRAGVRHVRLELISQGREATRRLVEWHRRAWRGEVNPTEALRAMQAESAYGLSLGALEPPRALAARPAGSRAKPAGRGLTPRRWTARADGKDGGGPARRPARAPSRRREGDPRLEGRARVRRARSRRSSARDKKRRDG